MTKINKMTPTNAGQLKADIDKLFSLVEKMYGVKINMGRLSYTDNELRFKTQIVTDSYVEPVPIVEGEAVTEYKGKSFNSHGITFTISKYNKSASKYPVIAVSSVDNKEYQFGAEVLKGLTP